MEANPVILLNDLLNLPVRRDIKVKFNKINRAGQDPLTQYIDDAESANFWWTAFRRGEYDDFQIGDTVVVLMKISYGLYLLTSVRKITGDTRKVNSPSYINEEIPDYKKYYGRVVVKCPPPGQVYIRNIKSVVQKMEVQEILPQRYSGRKFPGVTEVHVTLKEIIQFDKYKRLDWITPLANQKGIYLITDKKTKNKYVGSASGEEGLWQRWLSYANSQGSGGNVELVKLLKENPKYGIENFEYAVLETFGSGISRDRILEREDWWKQVLKTRQELNRN